MDPRELWPTFPFDEVAATVENTLGVGVGHAVRELAAAGAAAVPIARMTRTAPGRGVTGSVPRPERRCATRRSPFTAATRRTPRAPSPFRSTRRSRTSSSTRITPGRSWTSRLPGFHYNRINNPTVDVLEQRVDRAGGWSGGDGGRAPERRRSACRCSTCSVPVTTSSRCRRSTGPRTRTSPMSSPSRDRGPLLGRRPAGLDRGSDRRADEGGVLRDRRQPRRQRDRSRRRGRSRPRARRAGHRGQHGRDAVPAQAVPVTVPTW